MKRKIKKGLLLLLLILTGWAIANSTSADLNNQRIRIGLKLFRTILAADINIKDKQSDKGYLALALVYKNNKTDAQDYAKTLSNLGKDNSKGKIKKIPIRIKIIGSDQLQQLAKNAYAGIYIVEKLEPQIIKRLISYAIKHNIIIYSPFIGDVEQGITAGLAIEARVKPYINKKMLTTSNVYLKPFFIKVSKHYNP